MTPSSAHREFSPGRKGIAETYRGEFELVGAKLPLAASTDKPGRIVDAEGKVIAAVDYRQLSEDEAVRLARLIVQGVNWFALMGGSS